MNDEEHNSERKFAAKHKTLDLLETLPEVDPRELRVEHSVAEGLTVRGPDWEERSVSVKACFPITEPHRFVFLMDEDDEPIGLLEDVDDLDEGSREALLQELGRQQFLPVITKVNAIYREYAIPIWEVETDRGPRRLELKSTRDVHRLGGGRIYVRDAEGNGYVIRNLRRLDRESQELIDLYV